MRFSSYFRLGNSQAALDFVDVELSTDTRLYVDPFAIQIKDDLWSTECGDLIRSFFGEVLAALRNGDRTRAMQLLDHLHEPNETFLGQSQGRPSGRGVGRDKARWLASAIRNSRAYETGILNDISETALYIKYVGPDTISDLTTNILRAKLAGYTADQCSLMGVETTPVSALPAAWDGISGRWVSATYHLPIYKGRPVLLVPKYSVRLRMSIDSQEFYNSHMVEFLQAEHLLANDSLVEVLRSGERRVTKAAVKAEHPFVKDGLAEFVRAHPEILEAYKRIKGAEGAPEDEDLSSHFDARAFARALVERLKEIPSGRENADAYHELMIGVLTFLFYPQLIYPVKEQQLHGGRKRIDIKYTNAAQDGIFKRALVSNQMRASTVVIECKNYRDDVANEELDQLAGRFAHTRGFFGLSVSRTMQNRGLVIQRCRDTAHDGRGYIIPLADNDFELMLGAVASGNPTYVDRHLSAILDEITH